MGIQKICIENFGPFIWSLFKLCIFIFGDKSKGFGMPDFRESKAIFTCKILIKLLTSIKGQVAVEFKPGRCISPSGSALGGVQLSNLQVVRVSWLCAGVIEITLTNQLVHSRNLSIPWILMTYESANSVRERTSNWGRYPPLNKVNILPSCR